MSGWYHEAAVNTTGTYELPDEVEADLKTGVTTSASCKVCVLAPSVLTFECMNNSSL